MNFREIVKMSKGLWGKGDRQGVDKGGEKYGGKWGKNVEKNKKLRFLANL